MSELTRYRVNEPCLYPLDRVPGGCTPPYVAIDVYKADDVARVLKDMLAEDVDLGTNTDSLPSWVNGYQTALRRLLKELAP